MIIRSSAIYLTLIKIQIICSSCSATGQKFYVSHIWYYKFGSKCDFIQSDLLVRLFLRYDSVAQESWIVCDYEKNKEPLTIFRKMESSCSPSQNVGNYMLMQIAFLIWCIFRYWNDQWRVMSSNSTTDHGCLCGKMGNFFLRRMGV